MFIKDMICRKFSIIVLVHNVAPYLERCLNSLVHQTYSNIEIICVDDCSTDGSANIIKQFAEKESRIHCIYLTDNAGPSAARKKGVLQASGDYILFCDGDNAYALNTCAVLNERLNQAQADILEFGTQVIYETECSASGKKELETFLHPYKYELKGTDIYKNCYIEHNFGFTLWNKIYARDICIQAFQAISDAYIADSDDLYTFFLISAYARTFYGVQDKLYHYYYGKGITDNSRISFAVFKRQCTRNIVIKELKSFVENHQENGTIKKCFQTVERESIRDIVWEWKNALSVSDAKEGFNLLVSEFGAEAIVSELARSYWDESADLIRKLTAVKAKRTCGRPVHRIGVYYHRIHNGGTEKVCTQLLYIWQKLGFELFLITDEEPTEEDYPYPQNIKRLIIPSFKTAQKEHYQKRAEFWQNTIQKYSLDTIVYHSCTCSTLFWDVCMIKGNQANCIIETHSMFSGAMWYDPLFASYFPKIYRLADRVVSLSSLDVAFWNNYCPARYIPNPVDVVKKNKVSSLNSNNILWVGRFAEEKKPFAMLEAFSIVLRKNPEATLTMVGDGDSPQWRKKLQERAIQLKIDASVDFSGFKLNVEPYYRHASIFALTSLCESFSMVLAESRSYGLPTVMFELPNLELIKDGKGVISVPQDDVLALANAINELLENVTFRKKMGNEARQSIEQFAQFDLEAAWKNFFSNLELTLDCRDDDTSLMLDMLFDNVYKGVQSILKQHAGTSLTNPAYEEILNRHEEVVNRHEEVVNRHEQSINHQWEVQKWHEERLKKCEEILSRHEDVLNRHEEVVNRHEDVVNRHEQSINRQWEVQKQHEERLQQLEKKTLKNRLCAVKHKFFGNI